MREHHSRLSEQLARARQGKEEEEEEEMQSLFADIVVAMEAYLTDATAPIEEALKWVALLSG